VRRVAVDERLAQLGSQLAKRKDVVAEHDDLVAALLVRADEVLARHGLGGVAAVEQLLPLLVLWVQVLEHELARHGAPHLAWGRAAGGDCCLMTRHTDTRCAAGRPGLAVAPAAGHHPAMQQAPCHDHTGSRWLTAAGCTQQASHPSISTAQRSPAASPALPRRRLRPPRSTARWRCGPRA
jgi:hypothetical protein